MIRFLKPRLNLKPGASIHRHRPSRMAKTISINRVPRSSSVKEDAHALLMIKPKTTLAQTSRKLIFLRCLTSSLAWLSVCSRSAIRGAISEGRFPPRGNAGSPSGASGLRRLAGCPRRESGFPSSAVKGSGALTSVWGSPPIVSYSPASNHIPPQSKQTSSHSPRSWRRGVLWLHPGQASCSPPHSSASIRRELREIPPSLTTICSTRSCPRKHPLQEGQTRSPVPGATCS